MQTRISLRRYLLQFLNLNKHENNGQLHQYKINEYLLLNIWTLLRFIQMLILSNNLASNGTRNRWHQWTLMILPLLDSQNLLEWINLVILMMKELKINECSSQIILLKKIMLMLFLKQEKANPHNLILKILSKYLNKLLSKILTC